MTDVANDTIPDFEEVLGEFIARELPNYDIGIVTAELQNLAADCLNDSQDVKFIKGAIKSFRQRALGGLV